MALRARATQLPVVLVSVTINAFVLAGAIDAPGMATNAVVSHTRLGMESN